jgi:membrane protein implicated in regulation of membrane protease activity
VVPICLVLGASISSIARHLEVDWIYSSLMLVALSGTVVLGWLFELSADLVVFGLLPLLVVSALLVTRLAQNIGGTRRDQKEAQEPLIEKA